MTRTPMEIWARPGAAFADESPGRIASEIAPIDSAMEAIEAI